jgi:hypothetical protein
MPTSQEARSHSRQFLAQFPGADSLYSSRDRIALAARVDHECAVRLDVFARVVNPLLTLGRQAELDLDCPLGADQGAPRQPGGSARFGSHSQLAGKSSSYFIHVMDKLQGYSRRQRHSLPREPYRRQTARLHDHRDRPIFPECNRFLRRFLEVAQFRRRHGAVEDQRVLHILVTRVP